MNQLLKAFNLSRFLGCLQCTGAGGGHEAAPLLTMLLLVACCFQAGTSVHAVPWHSAWE